MSKRPTISVIGATGGSGVSTLLTAVAMMVGGRVIPIDVDTVKHLVNSPSEFDVDVFVDEDDELALVPLVIEAPGPLSKGPDHYALEDSHYLICERGPSYHGLASIRDKFKIDPDAPPASVTVVYLPEEGRPLNHADIESTTGFAAVPVDNLSSIRRAADAGTFYTNAKTLHAYAMVASRLNVLGIDIEIPA